jgi:hypothetical protein
MSFKAVIIVLIICIALIAPVYAVPTNDPEIIEYPKPNEHLKYQWGINNIEYSNGTTSFWITNYNAPEINLNQIEIKNHNTGEQIKFTHTNKVTKDKKSTANLWNLFGFFDPVDKLSKEQTLKITLTGDYLNNKNIDIIYDGITITHYGKVKEK